MYKAYYLGFKHANLYNSFELDIVRSIWNNLHANAQNVQPCGGAGCFKVILYLQHLSSFPSLSIAWARILIRVILIIQI